MQHRTIVAKGDLGMWNVVVWAEHCERFAGPRLTVCENSGVDTLRDASGSAMAHDSAGEVPTFMMSSAATATPCW